MHRLFFIKMIRFKAKLYVVPRRARLRAFWHAACPSPGIGLILLRNNPLAACLHLAFLISLLFTTLASPLNPTYRISANVGDNVILKCAFEYSNKVTSPVLIQWWKQNTSQPIYIYYEGFPTHQAEELKGRISLAGQATEDASLSLTNVRDSDQGMYECRVFIFMLSDEQYNKNGTFVQLDVNSPPHFKEKPPEAVFVKLGDSLTLHCRAHGTPNPTVVWQKENSLLEKSGKVRVHGGELHLNNIESEDTGTYTCIAKNRQGSIQTTTKVHISSAAEIVNPPRNTTVLEKNRVEMTCGAKATPSNITYRWYHKGILISQLGWLATRTAIKPDGTLVIQNTTPEDTGKFTCDATNGIGEPDTAFAYLSVEFPARVTFSPPRQYLPLGMSGIVRCYIQASPPLQFVTWTKDRRTFDPLTQPNVELLANGSLLFSKVTHEHQGFYRCTPYNIQGTGDISDPMEVIVREPPQFKIRPHEYYVSSLEDDVTMSCEGMGQPKPSIIWKRVGSGKLLKDRTLNRNGNITITNLRKEDFGLYECILKNEIATLVAPTALRMNGTTPYPPTNVTISTSAYAATLMWQPNFDGGLRQHFTIRYRSGNQDESNWKMMRVQPPESKAFSIYNLQPETEYEFQVFATNELGIGQGSELVRARTKKKSDGVELSMKNVALQTETSSEVATADGLNLPPTVLPNPLSTTMPHSHSSSQPGQPHNVTIEKMAQGWVVSWLPPLEPPIIAKYRVIYQEGESKPIELEDIKETAYLIKELKTSVKYTIVVHAFSIDGRSTPSEPIEYKIVNNSGSMKGSRAITAGVVGSVLFFVAAIILSVCTVKICNKRKQRKMEKAYMMVTCPVMDGVNGTHSHHGSPVTLKQIAQATKKDFHKAEYQV